MTALALALAASAPVGHAITPAEQARLQAPDVGECRWHKKPRPKSRILTPKPSAPVVIRHKERKVTAVGKPDDWELECTPEERPPTLVVFPPESPPEIALPPEAPAFPQLVVAPLPPEPCECFAQDAPGVPVPFPVPMPGPALIVATAGLPGPLPAIPEPETIYLMLAGFAALLVWRRA